MDEETIRLTRTEKLKLAKLSLRIVGAQNAAPGSFLRAFGYKLEQEIKRSDAKALHEQKAQSAERAQAASRAYIESSGSLSLNECCRIYGVTQRTLSRGIRRLRAKTETSQPLTITQCTKV